MQKIFNNGSRFFCLLFVASAFFFQACETQEKKPANDKDKYVIPDTVMHTLRIDTVISTQLINAITLTGKVGSNEDKVIPVNSLVTGIVQDVKVMLGDVVKAGQVLAVVRSSEMAGYSNDLVNAQSNLRISETNL